MFSDGECESLEDGELSEVEESSPANPPLPTCNKRKSDSPDSGNHIKMMHIGSSNASSLSSADQNESSPCCIGNVPDSGSQNDSKSVHSESEGGASTLASLGDDCGNGGMIDVEQSDLVNVCSPHGDDSSQENAKTDKNEDDSLPKLSDDNDAMCVGDDTRPSTSAKMTEFEIIDDISDDDVDGSGFGSEEFDDDDDDDSINEEDIDAMLDEGMVEYQKQGPGSADGSKGEDGDDDFAAPVEKEKVVLVGKYWFIQFIFLLSTVSLSGSVRGLESLEKP